ncbi:MAG: flippase-like domain-containing protein [Cyanobacteria bacterium SZAS LIN-3]|nr:flippase-like domain-containing protein [Cyanobacteria bacterium SZAS LIN-3]
MPEEQENPPTSQKNNLGKQLIAFAIAAGLLWWTFKDCNWAEMYRYLQSVQIVPVLGLFGSGLASHFLRAYRWVYLLQPLSEKKIGLFNSFFAVIIGYAVNAAIPRGGEVARLVSICRTENLPWAGVLSTMLIDRVLDLAMLVFLLGSCLLVLPPDLLNAMPWLIPGGRALLGGTVAGLLVLPFVGTILNRILTLPAIKDRLPEKLLTKLTLLAEQFDTGTKALKSPVKYPVIALLSFLIWFCYWLNFYLMVFAFGLQNKIDPLKCLIIFTIGSIGVLVPTPGNVGGFHYLVSTGMTMITDVPKDQALAFATFLHFLAFYLVPCIPALLLVLLVPKTKKTEAQ